MALALYAATTNRCRQRRRLLAEPFDDDDRRLLEQRVRFYRRLDGDSRRRFEDDVRIFLAEQVIAGAGDHEVDRTTRLLIAASAAMLTNGMPEWEWPRMRDIVVYPKAFDDDYHLSDDARVDVTASRSTCCATTSTRIRRIREPESRSAGESGHLAPAPTDATVPTRCRIASSSPWGTTSSSAAFKRPRPVVGPGMARPPTLSSSSRAHCSPRSP